MRKIYKPAAISSVMARILCLDDEQAVLRSYQLMFKKHDVTVASSAEEGLQIVRSAPAPFDYVITDQNMAGGGLRGTDVLCALVEDGFSGKMALVADCKPEDIAYAQSLGATYIPKPDTLRPLVEFVK